MLHLFALLSFIVVALLVLRAIAKLTPRRGRASTGAPPVFTRKLRA